MLSCRAESGARWQRTLSSSSGSLCPSRACSFPGVRGQTVRGQNRAHSGRPRCANAAQSHLVHARSRAVGSRGIGVVGSQGIGVVATGGRPLAVTFLSAWGALSPGIVLFAQK